MAGASERVRAMCLGTLILIWGIFSQKTDSRMVHSPALQHWLLVVALAAVIVLGLDVLEFLLAYQDSRETLGQISRPKLINLSYDHLQMICLKAKLLIGSGTLATLCVVLFCLLTAQQGKAQQHSTDVLGQWCGGDYQSGQHICLNIASPGGTSLTVQYNLQGSANWDDCTDVKQDVANVVSAACDSIAFTAYRDDDHLHTTATLTGGSSLTRDLKRN